MSLFLFSDYMYSLALKSSYCIHDIRNYYSDYSDYGPTDESFKDIHRLRSSWWSSCIKGLHSTQNFRQNENIRAEIFWKWIMSATTKNSTSLKGTKNCGRTWKCGLETQRASWRNKGSMIFWNWVGSITSRISSNSPRNITWHVIRSGQCVHLYSTINRSVGNP